MKNDIKNVLISEEELKARVSELGEQIKKDYEGKEPLCICVLKGAIIFMTDLIRAMDMHVSMDFMDLSSYGNATTSSGEVRIIKDLEDPVNGKDVLIIEDIFDTGLTLEFLKNLLITRGAASVKICSLLSKKRKDNKQRHVEIDYQGFEIPDEFVVGYGLDYAEKYRNLPFIGVLKEEVYQ